MRFQPGDTVGPYRVTGFVGEGASGLVYQVVNSVTGRLEAMKVLADSFGRDLGQAQRFVREIQLQAKLEHPNIAQVRTAFCEGNTIVLVMEFVDGESLSSRLARGPMEVADALRVAERVLNALVMAHRIGVVHRDVKPGNILIDRTGGVKLTDFGLAKQCGEPGQTGQGLAVGTVYYMAPEQVQGSSTTDWRADLYAVGVLLYEMLAGRRPFNGPDQFAIMRAQIEATPEPVTYWDPTLPKELDALLERALQKDPAQRFQSASGFLAALKELPITTRRDGNRLWNYATYAAALGSLLLAAIAVPPALNDIPPLQSIDLKRPNPPVPPAEAFRVPPVAPEAPVPAVPPVAIPARKTSPRAVPKPAQEIPLAVAAAEPPKPMEPPTTRPAGTAPPPLPPPPKMTLAAPSPTPEIPEIQPRLPTQKPTNQKPTNWMRRNLGRVPRIFRRREPEKTAPKEP